MGPGRQGQILREGTTGACWDPRAALGPIPGGWGETGRARHTYAYTPTGPTGWERLDVGLQGGPVPLLRCLLFASQRILDVRLSSNRTV
jgi:hypothetical protein